MPNNKIIDKNKNEFLDTKNFCFPQKEPEALKNVRIDSIKHYEELPFLSMRSEQWKYTNLRPLLEHQYNISRFDNTPVRAIDAIDSKAYNMIFLDGFYSIEESSMRAKSQAAISYMRRKMNTQNEILSQFYGTLDQRNIRVFDSLNTAYNQDGFFLEMKKFTKSEQAVNAYFISKEENLASVYRNFIFMHPKSKAEINFYILNQNHTGFINALSEIFLMDDSELTINIVENAPKKSQTSIINTLYVEQQRNSRLNINTYSFNGNLVRNDTHINLEGAGTETDLKGGFFPENNQHHAHHILINHKKPNCLSNQLYKGVLKDESSAVFNGKLNVFSEAQKTNAYQTNNNVLLSEKALMNAKPELEIYADDVKCSHGSTTGQMSEEELFYIRSRGITKQKAIRILVEGFMQEVFEDITDLTLREYLSHEIVKKIDS